MDRILVVGGGIAGAATALALHKAGIDTAVFEAHPTSGEDIGAFLTLASNGMFALAQLDAAAAVAAVGFPLTSMRVSDGTGTQLAVAPLGEHQDPLLRYRCLRRAELAAALRAEAVRRGIPVRHGARLAGVRVDETGITARFADGATARGGVLIGADGVHSRVRTLIDPDAAAPRYAGQRVFYGYTTDAAPPVVDSERIEMVRGSAAAFGFAVSPAGETFWFARVSAPELTATELAEGSAASWRASLVPMLRADATPAADIVAATGERLLVTNARDLPGVARWRSARMLLVGDAAHAASPATGQGASLAVEDAVVLAKALRDVGDVDRALTVYEALRRPRVERNIEVSARMSAARTPERAAPSGDGGPTRQEERRSVLRDEDLVRQLAWDVPVG